MSPRGRIGAVVWIVAWAWAGAAIADESAPLATSEIEVVTAKGRFGLTVEMAVTDAQRSRGLQHRRSLRTGTGMLFDFHRPQPVAMWMKDTSVALDMLFVAADGRVANIAENTVPFSLANISSAGPVRAVIEVEAGMARRLGVKAGDQVLHSIFGTAP